MLGVLVVIVFFVLLVLVVLLGSRQTFTRVDHSAPDIRRAGDERAPMPSRNHGGTTGLNY